MGEKLLVDPHSPAYEAARGEMVEVLRQIGREDSRNGYAQMADDLAAGNLMEVPTWIALALMATRAPADLRSALEAEREEARSVLTRIVVAHNRLRRSEITPQEFDAYGLGLLTAKPLEAETIERARPGKIDPCEFCFGVTRHDADCRALAPTKGDA